METLPKQNDFENKIPLNAIINIKQNNLVTEKNDNNLIQNYKKWTPINCIDDIKYLCRICLTHEKNMISLLSTIDSELLKDILSYITSLKVHLGENVPQQICRSCHNDLVQCYKFRTKSIKTDQLINKIVKLDNQYTYENLSSSVQKHNIQTQTDFKDSVTTDESGQNIEQQSDVKVEFKIEFDDSNDVEYLDDDFFDTNVDTDANYEIDSIGTQLNDIKGSLIEEKTVPQTTEKQRNKLLFCNICSQKFRKIKTLRAHMKTCLSSELKNAFSCGKCKETFSQERDLHIHSALHTPGDTWTCNECRKEFNDRNRFRRHIRRHMACWRIACDVCDKTFAEPCALRRHSRVHTGQGKEKTLGCDLCDKRFSERWQLAAHAARHRGERPCACAACGKAFPSPRLLASHARVHSDLKPHACLYCDRRFRHESTRNTHHRTHTGEKPYVCSVCGKTFIQNSNLRLHMRTHTGEKPYRCEECGSSFASSSSLSCHRRTHTGEKPYECPVCGKRCARTHVSSHARPFPCCACGRAFASAARLRDHRRVHTGERPYECDICSEKFRRKNYLAKHLRTHKTDKNEKLKNKKKNRTLKSREIVILRKVPFLMDAGVVCSKNDSNETDVNCENESIILDTSEEIPIVVSGELVLREDGDENKDAGAVDDGRNINCSNDSICIASNDVNYKYVNDVNFVRANEEVNVSSSASMVEETAVKLYKLDQSLVQIQTSTGHVTITKITSKNTSNL